MQKTCKLTNSSTTYYYWSLCHFNREQQDTYRGHLLCGEAFLHWDTLQLVYSLYLQGSAQRLKQVAQENWVLSIETLLLTVFSEEILQTSTKKNSPMKMKWCQDSQNMLLVAIQTTLNSIYPAAVMLRTIVVWTPKAAGGSPLSRPGSSQKEVANGGIVYTSSSSQWDLQTGNWSQRGLFAVRPCCHRPYNSFCDSVHNCLLL